MSYDRPEDCSWFPFKDEPVLTGFCCPCVISKYDSCDDKWHLYAHSKLGLFSFISVDGVNWKFSKLIALRERNCYIYHEDLVYYLFSVRNTDKKQSEILVRTSLDLHNWSRPKTILKSRNFSLEKINSPQVFKVDGKYRLYFQSNDSLMFAQSDSVVGEYLILREEKAIIKLEDSEEFRLVFCEDAFYSFRGKAGLTVYKSLDGINFSIARKTPVLKMTDKGWASNCINSCDVHYLEEEKSWYCYYEMKKSIGLQIGVKPTESKQGGIFQR